ncbi:MAG: phosphoribosylformylglycinamidine synthase, partial [Candidatus Nephrothrix sp. EaCA]
MIIFFKAPAKVYAAETPSLLSVQELEKLTWLFGGAKLRKEAELKGYFCGPRKEMITPWSTNAVEITQNMGIKNIRRIEEFFEVGIPDAAHDKMLQVIYSSLNQEIFAVHSAPEPVFEIGNIEEYNAKEGLALNDEEIEFLKHVSAELGRKLTDSEIFGFSQVNSEHCRHKIFNGKFILNGIEQEQSLFELIKKTAKVNPNFLVSAYKDNVAFIQGPLAKQFAPARADVPSYFVEKDFQSVLSLKAETHNFPTTVEPFNGAA